MKKYLTLSFTLLFPALASATGDPPMILQEMLGQAMSRGMVTYPLYKGQLQLKVAPGYIVAKDSRSGLSNNLKGGALTTALTYGLSEHWSLAWMMGYAKQSGTGVFGLAASGQPGQLMQSLNVGAKANGSFAGNDEGSGFVTSVNAVWDHWTGDNFRLPVYMGIGYLNLEEKVQNAALGLRRKGSVSSPAASVGVVPGVNLGKLFRFTGFLLMTTPFDAGKGEVVDETPLVGVTGAPRLDYKRPGGFEATVPIMGVELTYRPWGLSFGYTPAIEGATSYSLQLTRRWGPKTAAEVAKDDAG